MIPALRGDVEYTDLPLDQTKGFILSCIDGMTTVEEIADLAGVSSAEVQHFVGELEQHGAVTWVETSEPPQGHVLRPSQPPEEGVEAVELPESFREEVVALHDRVFQDDHYRILGVTPEAEKKEIRSAYFALSKRFHPDAYFGKELGPYKRMMEAIFKCITEAYEVLRKKKSRGEYDAYLKTRARNLAAERSIQRADRVAKRVADGDEGADMGADRVEPDTRGVGSSPRVNRRLGRMMADRLMKQTGRKVPKRTHRSLPTPDRQVSVGRAGALRDLTESLKGVEHFTGGVDRVRIQLRVAQRAEHEGNLVAAANALRVATALAPQKSEVVSEYQRVHRMMLGSLAQGFEDQARYEERTGRWAEAAVSWSKVCEGRTRDAKAHARCALAVIHAGGDLNRARKLAEKSLSLAPNSPLSHRAIARVFMEGGDVRGAQESLKRALKLDPSDEIAENLLRGLR